MDKYNNPWSQKDLNKLKDIYQSKTLKEMSLLFKRPISKVCRKAREIGLSKDKIIHKKNISNALKLAYKENRRNCEGENHPNWKGGIHIKKDGYITQFNPTHPNSRNRRILYHRYLVEGYLGRYLLDNEIVHHINGDNTDNRIENLMVMSQSEHAKLHKKNKKENINKF